MSGSPHGVFGATHFAAPLPRGCCAVVSRVPRATVAPSAMVANEKTKRRVMLQPSFGARGLLLELPVQQALGELHAAELDELCAGVDAPVQRQADRPRSREHRGVLYRDVVAKMIFVERCVALDDVCVLAREVAGAI